jgi:hypothetical protein
MRSESLLQVLDIFTKLIIDSPKVSGQHPSSSGVLILLILKRTGVSLDSECYKFGRFYCFGGTVYDRRFGIVIKFTHNHVSTYEIVYETGHQGCITLTMRGGLGLTLTLTHTNKIRDTLAFNYISSHQFPSLSNHQRVLVS